MAKRHRNRKLFIPGNGKRIAGVQEVKDPNVAPRGSAFTPQGATDLMAAVAEGVNQIMNQFNLRGYMLLMTMPLVEWRKDIAVPGGGTKDDFVVISGRTHACGGPFPNTPELQAGCQALFPHIWQGAFGITPEGAGTEPPAPTPTVLPDPPAEAT